MGLPFSCFRGSKKRKRGKTPNGDIPKSIRVSCALRYFAGVCAIDITLQHGISHVEVFKSVWMVVDAVNHTKELDIKFPTNHQKQVSINAEYKFYLFVV